MCNVLVAVWWVKIEWIVYISFVVVIGVGVFGIVIDEIY